MVQAWQEVRFVRDEAQRRLQTFVRITRKWIIAGRSCIKIHILYRNMYVERNRDADKVFLILENKSTHVNRI